MPTQPKDEERTAEHTQQDDRRRQPGIWWMVRRLRLALEVDCDARVIRQVGHPREYGLLLVAVGERHSRRLPLAISLAEQQPFLERRIYAVTAIQPRHPVFASSLLVGLALAGSVAVAQTPVPAAAGGTALASAGMSVMSARVAANQELVRSLVEKHYPGVLVAGSDIERVVFILDANDGYVASAALKSTGSVAPAAEAAGVTVGVGARAEPSAAGALDLTGVGLGTIDRSQIRGTASGSAKAGVFAPGAFRYYIVRLK